MGKSKSRNRKRRERRRLHRRSAGGRIRGGDERPSSSSTFGKISPGGGGGAEEHRADDDCEVDVRGSVGSSHRLDPSDDRAGHRGDGSRAGAGGGRVMTTGTRAADDDDTTSSSPSSSTPGGPAIAAAAGTTDNPSSASSSSSSDPAGPSPHRRRAGEAAETIVQTASEWRGRLHNGSSATPTSTPDVKKGGSKSRRRRVEFVYPVASDAGRGTLVAFSFRRTTVEESVSLTTQSSIGEEGGREAASGSETRDSGGSGETIDDILFPHRAKKKKRREQDEEDRRKRQQQQQQKEEEEQQRQKHRQKGQEQHDQQEDDGKREGGGRDIKQNQIEERLKGEQENDMGRRDATDAEAEADNDNDNDEGVQGKRRQVQPSHEEGAAARGVVETANDDSSSDSSSDSDSSDSDSDSGSSDSTARGGSDRRRRPLGDEKSSSSPARSHHPVDDGPPGDDDSVNGVDDVVEAMPSDDAGHHAVKSVDEEGDNDDRGGARGKKKEGKRKHAKGPQDDDGGRRHERPKDPSEGPRDVVVATSTSTSTSTSASTPAPAPTPAPAAAYGLSVEDAVRDRSGCRPRANSTDGELGLPRRGLCDERTVLASHRWNIVDDGNDRRGDGTSSSAASSSVANNNRWTLTDASANNPPRGLVNLGNTCFLNATMQCLAYLPTFCQCVTSSDGPSSAATATAATVGGGGGGHHHHQGGPRFSVLVRSLLRRMHLLGDFANGRTGSIAPKGIAGALKSLGERKGRFRLGRQEDAHEFLVHLLDAMKDGELREAGIDQRKSGWRDRLPIPRLDETTMIHRTFGGYFRSQVRCTICGYRSNTYDPFLDLELEVSKGINSVKSAIADFTRKETLDEANRWRCNGCKKRVCATKQLTVFRPPLSLCITLKRFSFGGGGFGGWQNRPKNFGVFGSMGGGGSKIRKAIEFPSHLSLPLSDKRKCEYVLTGVIIHIGADASSGHYTAYVKKPGAGGRHQWYHMDDSRVSAVSERTVLRESDAYVLFYCRKEVKLEFPSPPARSNMSASEATEVGKARARARADSIASNASSVAGSIASDESRQGRKEVATEGAEVAVGKQYQTPPQSDISLGSAVRKDHQVTNTSPVIASSASVDSTLVSKRKPDQSRLSVASYDSQCNGEESLNSVSAVWTTVDPGMGAGAASKETHDSAKKAKKQRSDHTASPSNARKRSAGKVVLDRGPQQGTVEVITGRARRGTPWKASQTRGSSDSPWCGVDVGTWDDGDDHAIEAVCSESVDMDGSSHGTLQTKDVAVRKAALSEMQAAERSRKRTMHLDRWDAALDEGKKKKVKTKPKDASVQRNVTPERNPFHHAQSKMQQLGKGHAKGTAIASYGESLSWVAPSPHRSSPSWLKNQHSTSRHNKKMQRMRSKGARRYGKGHRGGRGRGR